MKNGLLLLVLLGLFIGPAAGQGTGPERVRVGVALSGGGARGFAHIGALKVFDEAGIPVDLITGTSMGSVIGGLYAVGYSGAALERMALQENWADLFSDQPGRRSFSMEEKQWESRYVGSLPIRDGRIRLPTGLISGQKLMSLLAYYTAPVHHIEDFSRLPIPFACLAMDLETGEMVRIERGYLVDAIRASMSIPTMFTPVEMDGRVLVDGGVVRNLPAQDAREMGADVVISVDVSQELRPSEDLGSLIDILGQTFDVNRIPFVDEQRAYSDAVVIPRVQGVGTLDFGDIQGIIDRGEEAAREMLPRIEAVLDSFRVEHGARAMLSTPRASAQPPDSIYVTRIDIEGLEQVSSPVVRDQIRIAPPRRITPAQLDAAVDRVFSTQFFERVTYRLVPDGDGVRLVLRVVEQEDDQFRFGFRYSSRSRATLALNATFRNAVQWSSLLVLELQLGDALRAQGQHFVYLGRHLGLRSRARYINATPTVIDALGRGQRIQFSTHSLEVFLANGFSQRILYGLGLEEAYSISRPKVAPPDIEKERENLLMAFALLWYDSLDRGAFPSRGHHFFTRLTGSRRGLGSTATVLQYRANWRAVFPVSPRLSILHELQLATTDARDDLTINYGLGPVTLGGVQTPLLALGTFVGLKEDERIGRHLKAAMVGVQYEFLPRRFALLRLNAGNTFNRWSWDPRDEHYVKGLGLTLGALTALGPLEVTVATSNDRSFVADIRLGYVF